MIDSFRHVGKGVNHEVGTDTVLLTLSTSAFIYKKIKLKATEELLVKRKKESLKFSRFLD